MKTMKYFFLLLLIGCQAVTAQVNINQIKAPSSPSSLIIDNQVGSVNRPKSWSALEASLFSNFLNQQGSLNIPENFSLEFSPYWAQNNLKISNEDFLVPNVGNSFLQNLSFSISSSQNFILNDSVKSNALGLGIRTMIWQGTKTEKDLVLTLYKDILYDLKVSVKIYKIADNLKCSDCDVDKLINHLIDEIEKEQKNIFSIKLPDKVIKRLIKELKIYLKERIKSKDHFADSVESVFDEFSKIDKKVKDINLYITDRKGFKLEIASALALDFPTNETDYSVVPKIGLWLTPSYQPFNKQWIEFIGVFRYFKYNLGFYEKYFPKQDVYDQSFDYGGKIALKWKKYTLEFEGVGRSSKTILSKETDQNGITITKSKMNSDFQYVLNFNYQISENIILSYNFGKQFEPMLNYKGNLISLLSLNFALNSPKSKVIE
jgi:hypothetical protein